MRVHYKIDYPDILLLSASIIIKMNPVLIILFISPLVFSKDAITVPSPVNIKFFSPYLPFNPLRLS